MFKLPSAARKWITNAKRPYDGLLTRVINGDLNLKVGKIIPSKLKLLNSSGDYQNDELDDSIVAFAYYNGAYWANDGDFMLKNGGSPDDTFTADALASTPNTDQLGDIALFNGDMYVSEDNRVHKLSGNTWSNPISSGLTASTKTLLEPVENRLYLTDNNVKVYSLNTSDSLSVSGTNTLDLQLSNDSSLRYEITMLKRGTNQLWIGTSNTGGADNYVYSWNGETENTPSAQYTITSANILAGIVSKKDNRPYIFDSLGRLQAFNGAGFETIAQLPIVGNLRDDSVHYNGMVEDTDGTILINFSNDTKQSTYSPDAPSGVWAWSQDTGLYCKYAFTLQTTANTGSTGITEYGQLITDSSGALFVAREAENNVTSQGSLLASCSYTVDGAETNGIFVNNTYRDSLTYMQVVTRWMSSDGLEDTFTNVGIKHTKLLAGEQVLIKVRRDEIWQASGSYTAFSRYKLSTAVDLSDIKTAFDDGEKFELQITKGDDAAYPFQVKSITGETGSYIIELDRELNDATNGATFTIENWQVIAKNTVDGTRSTLGSCNLQGSKLQVKIDVLSKRCEIDEILVNNETAIVV